jgi:hypothetical protein
VKFIIDKERWKVRFASSVELGPALDGHCDNPKAKGKEITIHEELRGVDLLEVCVHEATHAAFWKIGEEHVAEFAKQLSKMLFQPEILRRILDDDTVRALLAPKVEPDPT